MQGKGFLGGFAGGDIYMAYNLDASASKVVGGSLLSTGHISEENEKSSWKDLYIHTKKLHSVSGKSWVL